MNKIIKDAIYGHIEIPKLCLQFIDTPEFQRLRKIKQLGPVHYVYPSAVHTRFEHSIGVMHLAGTAINQLRFHVPISERTKELIQLAGLYHDIGHFAFSHLFDTFLKSTGTLNSHEIFNIPHHEERSIYFLKQVNQRLQLLTDEEVEFVSDAILGNEKEPKYLYQIVNNKLLNIDVDRMDYLARDAYHTGLPNFQSYYIIRNMILKDNNIMFALKAEEDIKDMFATRARMYKNVYRHHTVEKIDKIYLHIMRGLGDKLFKYGTDTNDYNIETLMKKHYKDIIEGLECRKWIIVGGDVGGTL